MNQVAVCTDYYKKLLTKQLEDIESVFAANPIVSSPMDEVVGLEQVVKAAKAFSKHLELMDIIGTFEEGNQVVLEYVFQLFGVATKGVSIFTLTDDLKIEKVNLFYDSHPFRMKQQEIFG